MSIGERIRYIRNLRGMTQKELGKAIGFDDRTADIRIAQYENEARTPKDDLIKEMASIAKDNDKLIELLDNEDLLYIKKAPFPFIHANSFFIRYSPSHVLVPFRIQS